MGLFLGCLGCNYDTLSLHIENKTQDVLSIYVTGKKNKVYKFVEADTWFPIHFAENIDESKVKSISKYVDTILVCTREDMQLIYLSGAIKIDEKVLYKRGDPYYGFYFEIKEEDFGFGLDELDKGIDLKKLNEPNHENEENSFIN
jgi:hypothetical protein